MIRQRFVVMLRESQGVQTWLAYDSFGRIGNANFKEAFRYDTHRQAEDALRYVRMTHQWPMAEILGTTEEIEE